MNQFRRNFCERAFKIMDKDKSGVLNLEDIKGVYNAKKHPDVIKGKKTEEEILGEFLDTFEAHYAMTVSIGIYLNNFLAWGFKRWANQSWWVDGIL